MVISDRTKGCCSSDLNEPPHPNHDQFAELDAHNSSGRSRSLSLMIPTTFRARSTTGTALIRYLSKRRTTSRIGESSETEMTFSVITSFPHRRVLFLPGSSKLADVRRQQDDGLARPLIDLDQSGDSGRLGLGRPGSSQARRAISLLRGCRARKSDRQDAVSSIIAHPPFSKNRISPDFLCRSRRPRVGRAVAQRPSVFACASGGRRCLSQAFEVCRLASRHPASTRANGIAVQHPPAAPEKFRPHIYLA